MNCKFKHLFHILYPACKLFISFIICELYNSFSKLCNKLKHKRADLCNTIFLNNSEAIRQFKIVIMKCKLAIIGTVLTFALILPVFGQVAPTFEATTAGIHLKVWITIGTEEIKENDMSSAKASKDATLAKTYHIMVELKNAASGKEATEATATLMVVSPTGKNTSVELKPMMKQLGSDLTLDEKGEYELTVNVNTGGVTSATPFKFTSK